MVDEKYMAKNTIHRIVDINPNRCQDRARFLGPEISYGHDMMGLLTTGWHFH